MSGVQVIGSGFRIANWFQRNAWPIAKVAIPAIGGLVGGMALQQQLTGPTTGYNSGGAPITIINPAPSGSGSDALGGLMNSLPNLMLMMNDSNDGQFS